MAKPDKTTREATVTTKPAAKAGSEQVSPPAPPPAAPPKLSREDLDAKEAAERAEYDADKAAREERAAKPALVALPAASPAPAPAAPPRTDGKQTYRVWPHGELHRDGTVYKPGDTLDLTDEQAAGIPCVALAE